MSNSLSPNFFIKTFTIHSVDGASCVNIGTNRPIGFTSFKKHNQGFGSVSGSHNTIDGIKTLLNDESLFDLFRDSTNEDMAWAKEIRDLVISKVMNYLEEAGEAEDSEIDEENPIEFFDDHGIDEDEDN
ncbi:hypothetical protein [Neobacillus mesonae]|uniref:Uncharacterized protein n=1 Tax=Neobacillus mesonae TaxID=1193713 RepID=A0A3T0HWV8_9BACI|nr:hypothetical protein [Neobacillus mesonae]AZU61615.1 hypothetical protein CHR53_10195 [Neobacillus mesonae]